MNLLLASTSTLFGEAYLEYLKPQISELFLGINEIVFIPYARPSGISHENYTQKVRQVFSEFSISLKGLHEFENPIEAIKNAQAYFTGGGNTFLLVKTMHELGIMSVLKQELLSGKAYLGTSAGSNIGGENMMTTNDMPIVYPPSFDCMGLVHFNINAHYLDSNPNLKHNGETRETRIKEFHTQNQTPVVGLREGNWIRVQNSKITTEGSELTRIFLPNREAFELEAFSELKFP